MPRRVREEAGTSMLIITASLILLIGMAALALDLGAGFNERRQDQTAADFAVLAGALFAVQGGAEVVDQALDVAELNLDTTYAPNEWQSLWEACVDPAAERNAGGYNFVALDPPPGWTVTSPADWCISLDPALGLLRVRLPDQVVEAQFGGVIGTPSLTTSAVAVAKIFVVAPGGILPFGLPSGAGGGEHLCLSSAPSGIATDPCTGPLAGNFGVLKARLFGNDVLGTPENCTASPLGQVLAINIAVGVDHIIVTDPDGDPANEVRDECFNPFVDTMNTDTGFPNNGTEEGLVGPVPGGFDPRLERSSNTTTIVNGEEVDNTPAWDFLLTGTDGTNNLGNPDYGGTNTPSDMTDDAPASCDPASFTSGPMDWDGDGVNDDYDGDGNADSRGSWQHFAICLRQYVGDFDFDGTKESTESSVVMINESILTNEARFAYVPQFWESTLGTGNDWLHIKRFRAVYLQSTGWKSGNDYLFHHPGENCPPPCNSGGWNMVQLSAFTLPDNALPPGLRGNPLPPGSNSQVIPFLTELYR